ncbi:hypothetical protein ACFL2G_03670 [Candidatus Omnitrophota bacterium]
MSGFRKEYTIALIFILIEYFCVNSSYSESLRVPLGKNYKDVRQILTKINKKAELTDVDMFVNELLDTMHMLPLQSEVLKEIARNPKITNQEILSILSKRGAKHVNEAMVELLVNGELRRNYIIGLVKIIRRQIDSAESHINEIQTFALFGDELKKATKKKQRLMLERFRDMGMSSSVRERDLIAVNDLLGMFDNMVDDKELSYDFRLAIQRPMEIMTVIKQGEGSLNRFLRNINRGVDILEGLQHGLKDMVGEHLYSTEEDYFSNPSNEFNNILEWAKITSHLAEEDIGEWLDGKIQLMPWRKIELPISITGGRIRVYLKNKKSIAIPVKFLSRIKEEKIEKVVLMSFKDDNLGLLLGIFTPGDFEEWRKGSKIKVPLVVYKFSDKKQKPTLIKDPFVMDLELLSKGRKITMRSKGHPWSYQVKKVPIRSLGSGKVAFNLESFDIQPISLGIPSKKMKEYDVKNGEEVVCIILDDPNCGQLLRIVKLRDFNPENPGQSLNPLVEYLYIRDKFMQVANMGVIDMMYFAFGRKDLKESGRKILRKVRLIENGAGEINLKVAPNRKVWNTVRFYFTKAEIEKYNLTRKPAIIELKVNPDFGPYAAFSVENDGNEELFGTNLYVFEAEKNNMRTDLNRLALIFYALNHKNIHDNPVTPRVYKHSSVVPESGSIHLSFRGLEIRIKDLDALKGKKPIFVPENDARHGWVVKVYDQDRYDPALNQPPEVELVRNPGGGKNNPFIKKELAEDADSVLAREDEFGSWSETSAISQALYIYKKAIDAFGQYGNFNKRPEPHIVLDCRSFNSVTAIIDLILNGSAQVIDSKKLIAQLLPKTDKYGSASLEDRLGEALGITFVETVIDKLHSNKELSLTEHLALVYIWGARGHDNAASMIFDMLDHWHYSMSQNELLLMKSDFEKLYDKFLRLVQWDLKYRFPGRSALRLFHGTNDPKLFEKHNAVIPDNACMSDSPLYASDFGKPGIVEAYVPMAQIKNVWWLSFLGEKLFEPELLVSGGIVETRFRPESYLEQLKKYETAHKERYDKWKELTENIKINTILQGKLDYKKVLKMIKKSL